MPINTDDYETIAKKITTRFRGEPSFFAYNGEDESEPEPEEGAAPVERFIEMNRLAYIVKKIERDCVIVPRGALVVDAGRKLLRINISRDCLIRQPLKHVPIRT